MTTEVSTESAWYPLDATDVVHRTVAHLRDAHGFTNDEIADLAMPDPSEAHRDDHVEIGHQVGIGLAPRDHPRVRAVLDHRHD